MASLGRGAVVGAALASAAGLALSAEATARFSWVRLPGAETCADAATLRAKVIARLGRDPFSETAPHSIEGTVGHEGKRWVARLFVRDADTGALRGQRELSSEEAACSALDPGITLALALAIDPDGALSPAPSVSVSTSASASTSHVPKPIPSAVVVPAPSVAPAVAPDPPAILGLAVAGLGLVPRLGPGAMLSIDPFRRGLRPWFAATLVPGQRTDDREVAIGLATLRAGACASVAEDAHVRLLGCGALDAGVVTTVTFTLAPDAPGDRLFVAGVLSGRLQFSFGRVVLELLLEGAVPFTRYHFTKGAEVGKPVDLFRSSAIAPRAGLGVGWAL